ncbi:hypothetical protein Tco_0901394 [Tanacetum coccineum]
MEATTKTFVEMNHQKDIRRIFKQQYGNFKAEGSETLEQTFNRLQAIMSQLEFLDVPRNPKRRGGSSSQNMAFISSSNTIIEKVKFPLRKFFHSTTPQSGSQIKYEDITQIYDDNIEEMDIKWNMALLSIRADRFWKKTGKKITTQGSDVAGFDKSKVECFNSINWGIFARECRAPIYQDKRDETEGNSGVRHRRLILMGEDVEGGERSTHIWWGDTMTCAFVRLKIPLRRPTVAAAKWKQGKVIRPQLVDLETYRTISGADYELMMEDMCHLDMEVERLLAKAQ